MNCDVCEAEEVAFIVGNYQTGEQQFVGPACFARMGLEFAKAALPAEEIANVLGPMFVAPAQPGAAKRSPKRGSRKTPPAKTETEPAAGPAPRPDEKPAAAENG